MDQPYRLEAWARGDDALRRAAPGPARQCLGTRAVGAVEGAAGVRPGCAARCRAVAAACRIPADGGGAAARCRTAPERGPDRPAESAGGGARQDVKPKS